MTENQRLEIVRENAKRIKYEVAEAALKYGRNPDDVRIMAVTKTVPAELVNAAVEEGFSLLGENRAQELCAKYDEYSKNSEIHFIGRLQTNKVKYITDKVSMIQSVDSLKLAREISKHAEKHGKIMPVLVEINAAMEQSKGGINRAALTEFLTELAAVPFIKVEGLMTIPPADADELETEKFFSQLYGSFLDTREQKLDNINMYTLSMGMSSDYKSAIKHGSTLVRIGSALFGLRKQPI